MVRSPVSKRGQRIGGPHPAGVHRLAVVVQRLLSRRTGRQEEARVVAPRRPLRRDPAPHVVHRVGPQLQAFAARGVHQADTLLVHVAAQRGEALGARPGRRVEAPAATPRPRPAARPPPRRSRGSPRPSRPDRPAAARGARLAVASSSPTHSASARGSASAGSSAAAGEDHHAADEVGGGAPAQQQHVQVRAILHQHDGGGRPHRDRRGMRRARHAHAAAASQAGLVAGRLEAAQHLARLGHDPVDQLLAARQVLDHARSPVPRPSRRRRCCRPPSRP